MEVPTVDGVGTLENLLVTSDVLHLITDKLHVEPEVTQSEVHVEEPAVEAPFAIADGATTDVDALQYQTGSVKIYKVLCVGDPALSHFDVRDPGDELDPADYEACTPDDRSFTITPFGDEATYGTILVTTEDGMETIDEIATTTLDSGQHKISEDGTDLVENFDVEANKTTVIVAVNNYEQATGDLHLTKITCPGDQETQWFINTTQSAGVDENGECVSADETFSIYLYGDLESTPIPVNTGEEGFAEVNDLPVTADAESHLIVEDSTGAETEFHILEDEITDVTVINYEPPPVPDGTLEIEKLECSGIDDVVVRVGDPGDDAPSTPSNCSAGWGHVSIYLFGDEESDPVELDVDHVDNAKLPVTDGTPHLLVEVDGAGDEVTRAIFQIESDLVTPVQLRNPTYGSITVYSFICEGEEDSTFDVYDPGEAVTLPTDCDYLERDFTITIFGEDSGQAGSSTTFGTGGDGILGLSGLPATDDVGHLISKSGDVSAVFDVEQNLDTVIVSTTWEEDGGADDDSGDSENVDEVADTGSGPLARSERGTAFLFGLLSLASVIGLAAIARRRVA
jgi:hypothetical protein